MKIKKKVNINKKSSNIYILKMLFYFSNKRRNNCLMKHKTAKILGIFLYNC